MLTSAVRVTIDQCPRDIRLRVWSADILSGSPNEYDIASYPNPSRA